VRAARRRRLLAAALSIGVHAGVVAALVLAWRAPDPAAEIEPIQVALVELPRPEPPPPPEPPEVEEPEPESPPPPPPKLAVRPPKRPPPPKVIPLPATPSPPVEGPVEVGDSELASARTAGAGRGAGNGSGEGCDMVRWLQNRLRRDRMVQVAVADVNRGKAIRVWDGSWVRHPGQDGGGLAKVREAIMWEVGFAPEACKSEPVSGLVAISLNDGPGSARIVLGQNRWRWKDLLFAKGASSSLRR
jgi:hypothetical protein